MRKILFFFAVLLCLTAYPSGRGALALTPAYGRVEKSGVMLYKNAEAAEQDKLFELTLSYYVYIIDKDTLAECYEVEFQSSENGYVKIYGFVKKTDLTVYQSANSPLFPVINASFMKSSPLYKGWSLSSEQLINGTSGQNIRCYGKIYNAAEDKYFYYAKIGTESGYIPAENLNVTDPEPHPDPLPTPTPPPTPTPAPSHALPSQSNGGIGIGGEDDNTMQIILIAAISVPALIIVYLLFRPAKKNPRGYRKYYDEDDAE